MTTPTSPAFKATILGITAHLLLVSGCRSQTATASPEECAAVTTELPAASSAIGLAGEYRLRLVATSGAKKGAAAEGKLRLDPQTDSLRYRSRLGGAPGSTVLHPLYGATDVDLSLVDAVSVGSTTSLDPSRPGVLVMERRAAPDRSPRTDIIIRLGSDANRTDRQRFDGGYTALRVRQVHPGGLAGSWASGVATERAAGYFCATRTGGRAVGGRDG